MQKLRRAMRALRRRVDIDCLKRTLCIAAILGLSGMAASISAVGQDFDADCPDGTLWEPYVGVCAEVRDSRQRFLPGDAQPADVEAISKGRPEIAHEVGRLPDADQAKFDLEWPVPGSMAVGTTYDPNHLRALESGRLYTKMFVHPGGLPTDAMLPNLLYTTATSRVHMGLEVLGAYRDGGEGSTAQLGLFAWTCVAGYPCPDGDISPGWQWWIDLAELRCNITHGVDQGGHAHKLLYYTNQSNKLSDGDPPEWQSAIYVWNYCDAAWDLAWKHTYRAAKIDCSVPGAGCAWWGPSLEIFGDEPYPRIGELGYEDSLLYHDGFWSELRPPEANFRDPAIWARTTPWQLFHLDANRGFGVGNWFDENDPPSINGQEPLAIPEDQALTISAGSLLVTDADVDVRFHVANSITVYSGENYLNNGQIVTPSENFHGQLEVPVTVSDGAADSNTFSLLIDVTPVNDPPTISGQDALVTPERTPLTISAQNLRITDPDNAIGDLAIVVQDGAGYQRANNTITPDLGIVGDLRVGVLATDGDLESAEFSLLVVVSADIVPPELTLLGSPAVTLEVGDAYVDAGATAVDDVDGDISARIVTLNPVDTSRSGPYLVNYSVADLAGNSASVTRFVTVLSSGAAPDVLPPVLTLHGMPTQSLSVGDVYVDAGASAVDDRDGNITERIVIVDPVDTSRVGTYVVTYSVADLAGNSAAAARTVIVSSRPSRRNGGGHTDTGVLCLLVTIFAIQGFASRRRST